MKSPNQELDSWAKLKKDIYFYSKRPYFKERDVWWASIGFNIGDEVYGKNSYFERPVLVLKKFNNNIFLGVPLTSKLKNGRYHQTIVLRGLLRSAMVSQLRIFDAKRIVRKIGYIDEASYGLVLEAIELFFK